MLECVEPCKNHHYDREFIELQDINGLKKENPFRKSSENNAKK